jgi:flagellar basal-body rod protein FlgF
MTSAAGSLAMLERRQQVLANNLANVNTPGFKREQVFARLVDDAVAVTEARVDLTPGTLSQSGNPLDLGLEGDGFFVIQTPEGERHVRGGAFRLDTEGRLVDGAGNALLGEAGEILLPLKGSGRIEIDASGTVAADGRAVARLRVERIAAGTSPQHEGGVRFLPDASRQLVPPGERRVRQGFTEESNVNPMTAMTAMLEVLHRYGAAQKTISTLDAVRGIAVNELGKSA